MRAHFLTHYNTRFDLLQVEGFVSTCRLEAIPGYVAISPNGGRGVVFADEEASTTLSALHMVAVEPQRSRSRHR